jgi:hypothetical protein
MPTECNVDVLILRDGVKAAQSNLTTATTNKMKCETDNIVWRKAKEGLLFCSSACGHCQSRSKNMRDEILDSEFVRPSVRHCVTQLFLI